MTLFGLTLTLTFTYIVSVLLHPLRGILTKFGFKSVINSNSLTDYARSGTFDFGPDLDLTYDFFNMFSKFPQKALVESFLLPVRPPRYHDWLASLAPTKLCFGF